MGKKQEDIKQIIQMLLDSKKTRFLMDEIETAITRVRWVSDERSYKHTFDLMWKLRLVTQPELGVYDLNLTEIAKLDIVIPNNQQSLDVGRE